MSQEASVRQEVVSASKRLMAAFERLEGLLEREQVRYHHLAEELRVIRQKQENTQKTLSTARSKVDRSIEQVEMLLEAES